MDAPNKAPVQLGFTSLNAEIPEPAALALRGDIPGWLQGTLLRAAPGKFEAGAQPYRHWFDGLAMLHRFAITKTQILYSNRFLRTRAFCGAEQAGRIVYSEFATGPSRTFFDRIALFFVPKITDNANVNVSFFDGKMVALTETPTPVIFDPLTLSTLGDFHYDKKLGAGLSSAHPQYDSARDCLYSLIVQFGRKSIYRFIRLSRDHARQDLIAEIETGRPAYIHSFGMTENYLILAEFPFVVDPMQLLLSGKPFIENYGWEPGRGLRFHIIEKDNGKLVKMASAEPVFGFHHVNAFEQDGAIAADLIVFKDPGIIGELYLQPRRAGVPLKADSFINRYTIPLGSGTNASCRTLGGEGMELPQINAGASSKPYRFVWGTGAQMRGDFSNCIVKLDVVSGETKSWQHPDCYPGEPVFAAAPLASEEDNGVVLSVVLDAAMQRSFLLILDAASLTELARAEAPHHIPFGFHGNFYADRQASS